MTHETNQLPFINPEQGKRCVRLLWKANVPLCFVGSPATAKTSTMRETIEELNNDIAAAAQLKKKTVTRTARLWPVTVSRMEPGDMGVPVPDLEKKILDNYAPTFIPFDQQDAFGILFLDELDRGTPEMQNACLQLVLDRFFHGHTLADSVYVAAAMNGVSDIYTTQLSEANRTRMCFLYVSAHAEGYAESWDAWADGKNLLPATRAFRKYRADLIKKYETFTDLAVCNDRTLEMADRIMQASKSMTMKTDDILFPALVGVLGKIGAIEYMATEKLISEAPSLEDIQDAPEACKLPTNPSVIYALTCALVANVKNKDEAEKYVRYGVRLPAEFAATLLKGLCRADRVPAVATTVSFQKWTKENQAILIG